MPTTLEPETQQLADAIASRTGESISNVLREALKARAVAIGLSVPCSSRTTAEERYQRSLAIARRSAARPLLDGRSPDEIVGYDDLGLPS